MGLVGRPPTLPSYYCLARYEVDASYADREGFPRVRVPPGQQGWLVTPSNSWQHWATASVIEYGGAVHAAWLAQRLALLGFSFAGDGDMLGLADGLSVEGAVDGDELGLTDGLALGPVDARESPPVSSGHVYRKISGTRKLLACECALGK